MALDVRLQRADGAPWGFRLVGGADCDLPLTIAKVEPGSVAARAGLIDGDALLSVDGACTRLLTHEGAHAAITAAGDELQLAVVRATAQTAPMQATQGHAPIPFIDIVPSSQPPEVHELDRTLTSSPFILPLKPYRPFSAEPQEGIPPLEHPIILSPNYHDDFSKIKPKDFESPTIFKLEISKDYIPEESNERSVTESYSKVLIADMTSIEELNKEIDMEQIENTVSLIVEENLSEALVVSEEIKQEVNHEMSLSEEIKVTSDETQSIIVNSSEVSKVSVSLLAQLIDQTADEISKSNAAKLFESKDIKAHESSEMKNEVKVEETHSDNSKTQTVVIQHNIKKNDETIEVNQSEEFFSEQIKTAQINTEESSKIMVQEKHSSETSQVAEGYVQSKTSDLKNVEEQRTIDESIVSNSLIQEKTKNSVIEDLSENNKKVNCKQGKETITSSLTEIKQQAISTANLLAEQRAYTLGLQTIPNIQGHAHSSYHYDLLLKTFFIHLTDVMVALSRIILADGSSRSNSPMPPHRDDEGKRHISQQMFTQNNVQEHSSNHKNERIEHRHDTKDEISTNTLASKFSQSSLKTEEITQNMDAVISEFKRDVEEQVKMQDIKHVDREVRGKSVSKIEEEVSKEKDPLEWLAKIDESKTLTKSEIISEDQLFESSTSEQVQQSQTLDLKDEYESKESFDLNNKIIYVATVEAHQVSTMDQMIDCGFTDSLVAEKVATDLSEMDVTSEKISNLDIVSQSSKQEMKISDVSQLQTFSAKIESENSSKIVYESSMDQETKQTSTQTKDFESTKQQSVSESLMQAVTIQSTEKSSTKSEAIIGSIHTCNNINEAPLQSTNEPTPPETRKGSIKNEIINGHPEDESVRKPQLETQLSVASDCSNSTIVPQTPLTDEYVFRLQIHVRDLDESKTPERVPTPPEIHEDPYTVKKPKLIPHIDTSIEPVKYFIDPQKELEPPGSNYIRPDTKIDQIAPTIEPIEKTTLPANFAEKTAPTVDANERITTAECLSAEDNAIPGTGVDKNALLSLPIVDNIAPSFLAFAAVENYYEQVASNANNTASTESFGTNIGTSASELTHAASRTSATLVEEYIGQDIIAEECRRASLLTSAIDNTIKDIERYKQDVGMGRDINATFTNQNGGFAQNGCTAQNGGLIQNCGSLTQNGSVLTDGFNGLVNGHSENGITYRVEDLGGTIQGIVDALDNGGIIDEEIAKKLGKPGLTDDKIAAVMSGEAEMLREAHVIGLKRVIASHMNRLNEDDDSVDFKKIKPQIDALRESEVLKALNDELAKTKEERRREERRWTTFLQRPERAVPCARFGHIVEPLYPQEQYKIKIVKQPKPRVAPDYKPQDFETGPLPWELRAAAEPSPPPAQREDPVLVPEAGPVYLEALDNLPESEVPDLEDTGKDFETGPLPWELRAAAEPSPPPAQREDPVLVPEAGPVYLEALDNLPESEVPDLEDTGEVFETGPLPWELRAAAEPSPPPAQREDPVLVPEAGPVYLEALDNLPESEVPDLEDTGIPLPPETSEAPEAAEVPEAVPAESPATPDDCAEPSGTEQPLEEQEITAEEMEQNRMAEQILGSIQNMVDPHASMEQQLVQMRAQLAALAQLPGVISQTLQLVTEQLGELTRTQEEIREEVQHSETTITEIKEEVTTTTEVTTSEVSEGVTESAACEVALSEQNESTASVPSEVPAQSDTSVQSEVAAQSGASVQSEVAASVPKDIAAQPTEAREDGVILQDEQRRVEHHKKELMAELQHEQRQTRRRPAPAFGPRAPAERPLVLPGGRRWRGPRDALNDEFIRETLAAQAEIIRGNAKGCQYESVHLPYDERINFMKWEKPAKSLDYLKESDVYKLVHNMDDLPARRVDQLRAVVLAESEYREDLESNTHDTSRLYKVIQDNGASAPSTDRRVQTFPPQLPPIPPKKPSFSPQAPASPPRACTELVLPPNLPRAAPEPLPRPSSLEEAVEIVTSYVDTHAHSARTAPASH